MCTPRLRSMTSKPCSLCLRGLIFIRFRAVPSNLTDTGKFPIVPSHFTRYWWDSFTALTHSKKKMTVAVFLIHSCTFSTLIDICSPVSSTGETWSIFFRLGSRWKDARSPLSFPLRNAHRWNTDSKSNQGTSPSRLPDRWDCMVRPRNSIPLRKA